MSHYDPTQEIRQLYMFKLTVFIVFLAILLCLVLFRFTQTTPIAVSPAEASVTPNLLSQVAAPTLNLPAKAKALPSGDVRLTGTGEAGQEVQIVVDGQVVGTTQVAGDGTWQLVTSLNEPGEHEITVQALDSSGTVLASSAASMLWVASPTEEASTAEVATPTVELPSQGSITAGDVTLTGRGEAGQELQIVVDGQVVGTTEVADGGTWQLMTSLNEPGEHEISVQTVDSSGTVLASSIASTLWVASSTEEASIEEVAAPTVEASTEEVAAPTVEASTVAEVAAPTVELPSQGSITAGDVTLTGRGDAGQEVQIVVDGQVVGTTQVAGDGTWQLMTSLNEPGEHEITVQTVDSSGTVLASSAPSILSLASPTEEASIAEVAAPTVEAATEEVAAPTVEAATEEVAAPTVEASTVAEVAAPTVELPSQGSITAGDVTLTGRGDAGQEVQIVVDGQVVGTTQVAGDGTWQLTTSLNEPREHEITVQTVDENAHIVASSQISVLSVTGLLAEGKAASLQTNRIRCEQDYIVLVDDWLIKIASKFWGDGMLYPAIVIATNQKHAEDETFAYIANPHFIKPKWKLCLVDAATAWKQLTR